jgi:hypothetical protein
VSRPDPNRVAAAFLAKQGRTKVAGEVIFKKDRGDDLSSWAYNDIAPSAREIGHDYNYSPKNAKNLARILRATLAALGHSLAAYNQFAKVKSAKISPDGNLGGKGYIQKISDMRKQFMNIVEALSSLSDTIYDEVNAPHWSVVSRQEDDESKAQVADLIQDVEKIREDPQEWAQDQIQEEFHDEPKSRGKTAGLSPSMLRVARVWRSANGIPGGLADEKVFSDFDPEQLAKGTKIEKEHTNDPRKAKEIAADHLVEDPAYYDKLETIEGGHH